jgi:hypothetical protein
MERKMAEEVFGKENVKVLNCEILRVMPKYLIKADCLRQFFLNPL